MEPEPHIAFLSTGKGDGTGGASIGDGKGVVMPGETEAWTDAPHEIGEHDNAHGADAAGSLTAEGLMHQQHGRLVKAAERRHIIYIEVAHAFAGEWLFPLVPGRGEVTGKADNANPGAGNDVVLSRPKQVTEEVIDPLSQRERGSMGSALVFTQSKHIPVLMVAVHPDEGNRQIVECDRIVVWLPVAPGFAGSEIPDLQEGTRRWLTAADIEEWREVAVRIANTNE